MEGSIEIFHLPSGDLVFSSGNSARALCDITRESDFLIIRRLGRGIVPKARIITMSLGEFFNWYWHGQSYSEAFSSLSRRDFNFLETGGE